ncbi:trigger factor [Saccharobesus litoralis]|uniref:Trigger factor n=1 Tax=Saccharobesus litoralis TaxID=2172099 RepID=A0A2S0VVX4_9ALTE|nr:trigger factor [Saccharobesus litoralis]AWB68366.1 trigger factor [Saccharobesus litoralis]
MQVSVETTQGLERRLKITVPGDSVDQKVNDQLRRLSKTQRIDGFRPGKVPVSIIKKRYGAAVRQDVANEVVQQNFYQAVIQEKLTPAGAPQIEIEALSEGKDFEFTATFEVYPEVTVEGLDKLEVEKVAASVKDEDLDNMIETLRGQHATWKEIKRKSKKGEKVTIDFVGSIDGEEFEGGKAENFELELGSDKMIPGFEKGIIGMKTGEEQDITVTFPEDYQAENLKGKEAVFKITVHKVEEKVLPEIDDEFCAKFGVEEGGLDALKVEVRKNMERELNASLKLANKNAAIDALTSSVEVDIPKALIDQEVEALRQQAVQRFGGNTQNVPELPASLFEDNATKRVKTGLVLSEVIKANEIKADDDKVKALIEDMASAYEDPSEVVDYYMGNEELLNNMRNVAIEEQAVDFILTQAKVSEVEKSFDEIMNKQA